MSNDAHQVLNLDIQSKIKRLTAKDIIVYSEVAGPRSIAVSLGDIFDNCLDADVSIKRTLRDADFFALIDQAISADKAERYISGKLYAGDETRPIGQSDRVYYIRTLCRLAVAHDLPDTFDAAMAELRETDPAYKVFSLANALWNIWPQIYRSGATWAAAFLLYDELASSESVRAPQPVSAPLDLRGYQDLRAVVEHLLSDKPGETLFAKIMTLLPMGLLRNTTGQLRLSSRKEVADNVHVSDRADGRVHIYGETLSVPADLALDAVLNSAPFVTLQRQLVQALEWYAPADSDSASSAMARQLATQALIDCIYPIEQRRAGYILDFHLFDPDNADSSLYDIRIDLINSLRKTLDCTDADAQVVMQLLASRFVPELLLTDAPADWRYEPDLRWANLRHAIRLGPLAPDALTFAHRETLPARLAARAVTPEEKLRIAMTRTEAMIIWGVYAGVISDRADYLPDELDRLARHFESACNLQALNALPDRINDARHLLIGVGIDPDAANTSSKGTTTELEAYLDDGAHYRPPVALKIALDDPTQQFDRAFDRYVQDARETYTDLMNLFLEDLPQTDRERLLSGIITCYAAVWRQYVGPDFGVIPSIGSSPEEHWRDCRGGHGAMVHVTYDNEHFLYELFPERHTFVSIPVTTEDALKLADPGLAALIIPTLTNMDHQSYCGGPLPYERSNLSKCQSLLQVPGADNQAQLVKTFVEQIFLHHSGELRAACKGATRRETQTRLREATSDAAYAWRLIKSVVPIVGCFDVNSGADAATCIADVAGDFGTVMTLAGRTIRPLIKLGSKNRLGSTQSRALLSPRKQSTQWFGGQDVELRLFERGVLAAHKSEPTCAYSQRLGMFQRISAGQAGADASLELALVDSLDNVLVRNISTAETPDYRWCNPEDLKPYGPRLSAITNGAEGPGFATTQSRLLPGQFPGAVQLKEVGEHGHDLLVTVDRKIHVVRRNDTVCDLIVDNISYRFDSKSRHGLLRKVELQPVIARLDELQASHVHCVHKRDLTEVSCSGPLVLLSTTRPAAAPEEAPLLLGEQASHAFMTRRFRPVLRSTPRHGHASPSQTHLLVDDGKISTWIDEMLPVAGRRGNQRTGRKILADVSPETALHMGITATPQYRSVIKGRLMRDQTLGLAEDIDDAWRSQIDQQLPVVQLDSICLTVNDQREMRALRLTLDGGPYLAVEADTGQFYKAREVSGESQLTFTRMTSDAEIDAYLYLSEAYRLGAGRRTLKRDMENIARMLYELENPGSNPAQIPASDSEILANYAKNILTRPGALENFVRLSKDSIPNFKQLGEVDSATLGRISDVFDALLPVTGAKHPWSMVAGNDIPLRTTGEKIRKHLNSTNLAFLMAETSDGKLHVYYALAGGKRGRSLTIPAPVPRGDNPTIFIDARERMRGQVPDPEFTSLPVVRTAAVLRIREHDRYLDAERLIATVFKNDMRGNDTLTKIHFFTLMDTCNSCGGFVMPRLKLDFPNAEFSVSYILPYTAPV